MTPWASVILLHYLKTVVPNFWASYLSHGIRASRVAVIHPWWRRSTGGVGMDSGGRFNNFGIEVLNHSKYKIWRLYMASYLVGEDLWEVVGGDDVNHLVNTPENVNNLKKWWIANVKAKSILKRSISHGLFEHIIGCNSVGEIWTNLDALFSKKDVTTRLIKAWLKIFLFKTNNPQWSGLSQWHGNTTVCHESMH